jgi:hypothetical protein
VKPTYIQLRQRERVKLVLEQTTKVQRGNRHVALLILNLGARRGSVVSTTPRPLYPREILYPLYRRLCGPQGRSGRLRKISPPPAFDPPIIQPVVSRYTDLATRPTKRRKIFEKILGKGRRILKCIISGWWKSTVTSKCRFKEEFCSTLSRRCTFRMY